MIEQPAQLAGGEIGVERQACPRPGQRLGAVGAQPLDRRKRASVLPDDGVGERPAAAAVPGDDGLALEIGDVADAAQIEHGQGLLQALREGLVIERRQGRALAAGGPLAR